MLSRNRPGQLSKTLSDGNLGHAEKLYLQDIVLSTTVRREAVTELVFIGGTALMEVYQLDRYSEDLDFTARAELDFDGLVRSAVRDLENFGAAVSERSQDEIESTFRARLEFGGRCTPANGDLYRFCGSR